MKRFLLPLAAALAAACGASGSSQRSFQGIALKTLKGGESALASCSTKKCLTVYVAPWCGYCRKGTPMILELRKQLGALGVDSRVIVGMDRLEALREYAKVFGPDTYLDPDNVLGISGVPDFFVSNGRGEILRKVAGLPDDLDSVKSWVLE